MTFYIENSVGKTASKDIVKNFTMSWRPPEPPSPLTSSSENSQADATDDQDGRSTSSHESTSSLYLNGFNNAIHERSPSTSYLNDLRGKHQVVDEHREEVRTYSSKVEEMMENMQDRLNSLEKHNEHMGGEFDMVRLILCSAMSRVQSLTHIPASFLVSTYLS